MSEKKRNIKKIMMTSMLIMFLAIFLVVCIVIGFLIQQIRVSRTENMKSVLRQTEYQITDCISQLEGYEQVIAANRNIQTFLAEDDKNQVLVREIEDAILPYKMQSGGRFKMVLLDNDMASYDIMNDVDSDEIEMINKAYKSYISNTDSSKIHFFDIQEKTYDDLYVCLLSPIEQYNLKEVGKDRVGTMAIFLTVNKVAFWQSVSSDNCIYITVSNSKTDDSIFINKKYEGDKFGNLEESIRVENTDWYINCSLYDNPIHSPFGVLLLWIVLLVLILVLFVIVMNTVFTKTIDKPVTDIIKFLSDYHIKKRNIERPSLNVYEFDEICSYTFKMIDKINDGMRQIVQTQEMLYEKTLSEKEHLLYMYQLQINPHFLYNTLACISGLATKQETEGIIDITEAISDIFRYSLTESFEATVENEIYIAQKYISILKIRYPNQIDYRIEVEDEILDYPILKMLLQPIIENSYKHGISPKEGGGTIIIKGYWEEDFLVLAVVDNGSGMTSELYESIQESLKHPDMGMLTEKSKKIGILNINSRVKIRYGEKSGVELESEQGKYTEVRIKIFCGDKRLPQNENEVL